MTCTPDSLLFFLLVVSVFFSVDEHNDVARARVSMMDLLANRLALMLNGRRVLLTFVALSHTDTHFVCVSIEKSVIDSNMFISPTMHILFFNFNSTAQYYDCSVVFVCIVLSV